MVAVVEPVEDIAGVDGVTGEVTYDVVGFADDSVAGERLRITGRRMIADLPHTAVASVFAYELIGVESTIICYRGVTADGICL